MRRFGLIFRPVRVVGVRQANSISSRLSASLIVSRENRLRCLRRGFQPLDIRFSFLPISSFSRKATLLLKAVIFDIDGTLVDSVDLHARAWQEAFAHFGHQVEFSAVRSQIGKGGDQLMPVFLSKEEIDSRGQEIEEYRSKVYKQQYLPKVRGFPEVRQLIESIKGNGLQVVLASSAKSDELQIYKRIAGVEDLIDEETSADDAAKSKPNPDIFKATLDR